MRVASVFVAYEYHSSWGRVRWAEGNKLIIALNSVTQELKSAGQAVDIEVVTSVDHFDLLERLSDPHYTLAQASSALYSHVFFFVNLIDQLFFCCLRRLRRCWAVRVFARASVCESASLFSTLYIS